MQLPRKALAASLMAATLCAHADTIAVGTLSDPLEASAADLASAIVSVGSDRRITLSVSFGPASTLATARAQFVLDTDRNPATGRPGINSLGADAALFGTDFTVTIQSSSFQGNAFVSAFAADGSSLGTVATWPVVYDGAVFTTVGSLDDIGGGSGLLNFKVNAQRQTGTLTSTPVLDTMSDIGLPVGTVSAVPEPGSWALFAGGALLLGWRARRSGR